MNDQETHKLLLARIDDLAEAAMKEQAPQWTDFLEPPEREQAEATLRWKAGVRFNSFGGYPKAERRRLVIYPDYYFTETIETELAFLEITPTGRDASLTHRDYLGAMMGLGINRAKTGDFLVAENSAQVVVVPELFQFIINNLTSVGNSTVKITPIDPEQLNLPDRRVKEIKTTVASLRLDALAALGFGDSRTKMARDIRADKVKVNWKPTRSPDQLLGPGDIISIRGRGRVEFREVTGQSKKGRTGIVLVRLI